MWLVARRATTVAMLSLILASSCATQKETARLSDDFVGYWMNQHLGYQNWWEIGPMRVLNYGVALDKGRCTGREAKIIGRDRLEVDFGNKGEVRLQIKDGKLLFTSARGVAVHIRVPPNTICSYGGAHFEGAPFP